MNMARRWLAGGRAGNIPLADDILGENVRANGVAGGAVGPKRRIQERLAGFPDLTTDIVDMFSVDDKIVTRPVWRGTHTGSYGGIKASSKQVAVPDFAAWRFGGGKVAETSTIQDQFSLLKQIGYLPHEVYAAWPVPAGRDRRDVQGARTCATRSGPALIAVMSRRGGRLVLAVADGNGLPGSILAEKISPIAWENPGIRLSETRPGARASG